MSAEYGNFIVFLQTYLETNLLTKPIYYEKVTFIHYAANGGDAAVGGASAGNADRK